MVIGNPGLNIMVQMDDKCNVVCGNPGEPQCLIARSRRVCPYQSYTQEVERIMAMFNLAWQGSSSS